MDTPDVNMVVAWIVEFIPNHYDAYHVLSSHSQETAAQGSRVGRDSEWYDFVISEKEDDGEEIMEARLQLPYSRASEFAPLKAASRLILLTSS